jgi:VIT1/CCC1 family predicted Fe2+/Mn2+ transporter
MKTLVRLFGAGFVLPTLAAAEYADRNKYHGQPDAGRMSADEHHHAAVVQTLAHGGDPDMSQGARIAAAESWHKGVSSGNDLRAAVLGANDGLVSNFCLIMGVAGAGTGNKAILLTGLAGLIAGACSMALGEWLSVTNARELASTQIAKEANELETSPEAEEHELALIYRAKGLEADEAKRVASQMMRDKDKALDTLTREELGLDPAELGGNPWSAAGVSFCLFSVGAIFPAMPFLWTHGLSAIAQCIVLSALALASIGVFHHSLTDEARPFPHCGRLSSALSLQLSRSVLGDSWACLFRSAWVRASAIRRSLSRRDTTRCQRSQHPPPFRSVQGLQTR